MPTDGAATGGATAPPGVAHTTPKDKTPGSGKRAAGAPGSGGSGETITVDAASLKALFDEGIAALRGDMRERFGELAGRVSAIEEASRSRAESELESSDDESSSGTSVDSLTELLEDQAVLTPSGSCHDFRCCLCQLMRVAIAFVRMRSVSCQHPPFLHELILHFPLASTLCASVPSFIRHPSALRSCSIRLDRPSATTNVRILSHFLHFVLQRLLRTCQRSDGKPSVSCFCVHLLNACPPVSRK